MISIENILNSKTYLILGVGNIDRGDDGIGNYIVSKLETKHKIDCEFAPENFTSKIRRINPEIILIIDAVDFGGKPGETMLTEAENADHDALSTHSLPLSLLCRMLPESKIYLLGIQPKSFEKMTQELNLSAQSIIKNLNRILK
ncbi:MAG: hydrogenase maturation protease [Candidatus Micrarchaeota archaeon]